MLSMIAMVSIALQAADDQKHAEHFNKCASVCAGCQLVCDSCFEHCLTMAADGKKEHAEAGQYCLDCAECCKACATLCARKSPLAGPMLECCVTCCELCAESCEKFPDDQQMVNCAKECRDCAQHCQEMVKMLGQHS